MTEAGRKTVLVVDDDEASAELLGSLLTPHYDVLYARDGFESLHVASEALPDLILLDIQMPKMDGYVACRLLRSDPLTRNTPVIFVSALDSPEDIAKGLDLGAIDYVTKPVSPPILLARIRNHIQLKEYRDLLDELSSNDGLTGIANRRRFDEVFAREWQRAVRMASPTSVILGDIDHFKQFNDHAGHQKGDECLREVARAMSAVIHRPTDLLARYGGEEFICLLPDTDHDGAMVIAERLREGIESLGIAHPESKTADHVTMSLGAATMVPAEGQAGEILIERADQRLYAAKAQGRNRVVGREAPATAEAEGRKTG